MCGIIGYLDRRPGRSHPVGRVLLAMLRALACRGPDSAGVALYGPADEWQVVVSIPPGTERESADDALRTLGATPRHGTGEGVAVATLPVPPDDADAFESAVTRALPGSEVLSLGRRLHLVKQVGSPELLERHYHIGGWTGTHGIGHTRMSTESKVDLSHSQPFWAHGVPDLATVHNGHITNYHKLRRRYEQRGFRFFTENDSEIIGIYLRDRLAQGLPLPDALAAMRDDFDGSFSIVAATADCLAIVKDGFGFKPLLVAETEQFVAVATEETALRRALGTDFPAWEPTPGTMRVWNVTAATHRVP